MKISTKGRYGLRALIDLATYGDGNQLVYLSDVAKREGISAKYLEHIFSALQKAGLIRSVRGKKGGYMLSRSAREITLSEIMQTLEGSCILVDCVSEPKSCHKVETCASRELWMMLSKKIEEVLKSITLADLKERQKEKITREALIYEI